MSTHAPDQGGVRIARNTSYLTVAFVIQKVLSFGFFIYYARLLGPEDTGRLVTALSLATLFGILIDLGFSPILIREISRARGRAQEFLGNVLWVKIFFAAITFLALLIFVYRLSGSYEPVTRQLVFFAGAITILESLTLSLYGVFRGFQDLRFEAIGSTLFQVAAVTVGVIGLQFTQHVFVPAAAMLVGAVVNFSYALASLKRKHHIRFSLAHSTRTLTFIIQLLWPFLIAGVFTKIYAFIDVVLLSLLAGEVYVGWYAAALKLILAIQFVPLAFNNSIYPAFSEYFVSARERLVRVFDRAMFFLAGISLPITAGLVVLADRVVPLFSESFNEAVPALQITALALFFLFANIIFSSLLNAANAQRKNTLNLGIAVVVSIVLNLILIPSFQHIGTSVTFLVSATVLFLLNFYWARRIIAIRMRSFMSGLLKSGAAALGMAAALLALKEDLSIFLLIPLGGILYLLLFWMFGGFTFRQAFVMFRRFFSRNTTP